MRTNNRSEVPQWVKGLPLLVLVLLVGATAVVSIDHVFGLQIHGSIVAFTAHYLTVFFWGAIITSRRWFGDD